MMLVTALGSLPGTDFAAATRLMLSDLPDLAPLPELPARGVGSEMIGRALALTVGMSADLQPAGWRLTDRDGADLGRARSQWRRDLDDLEEQAQGFTGTIKLALAGPWTLACLVERPRGDKVLADHGARRDLADSLAEGVVALVDEMSRRLPGMIWWLQLDEPLLPDVMAARVPTASGFSKHRGVDQASATELLGRVVARVHESVQGTTLHCCASGLDLGVVHRAGIDTVALDVGLLGSSDLELLAEWIDAGRTVWWGLLPAQQVDQVGRPDQLADKFTGLTRRLGLDLPMVLSRSALTPSCGLAGWSPAGVTRALACLDEVAGLLEEQAD